IEMGRAEPVSVSIDRSSWTSAISNLLRVVRAGKAEARARAASRLAVVNRLDLLSDTERVEFGRALWSRIDSTKGLPADTHFLDFSFLHLPEREAGEAKR